LDSLEDSLFGPRHAEIQASGPPERNEIRNLRFEIRNLRIEIKIEGEASIACPAEDQH
jgi:hypothetical protein